METKRKSTRDVYMPWFRFDHSEGLREFDNKSSLSGSAAAIALRTLKYHLEEELGLEISDELFIDIFSKVCCFNPRPALEAYAVLEFMQPLQRILDKHDVPKDKDKVFAICRTFRVNVDNHRCYNNLLLHIPHSSMAFPTDSCHTFADLNDDERLLVDYYTDELFAPRQKSDNIVPMVFPHCRLCCDVERLVNDPLEKEGLGIRYAKIAPTSYRSFNTTEEAFGLYADFHAMVSKAIVNMSGGRLLVDCHSFSALPNLLNSNPPDVDICIGFNDDDTRPDKVVIGNIVQHFKSLGYKASINEPFSNSKTFAVPVRYHSVMIEVNKRLYMNEHTLEKKDGFERLKQEIQDLYSLLLC